MICTAYTVNDIKYVRTDTHRDVSCAGNNGFRKKLGVAACRASGYTAEDSRDSDAVNQLIKTVYEIVMSGFFAHNVRIGAASQQMSQDMSLFGEEDEFGLCSAAVDSGEAADSVGICADKLVHTHIQKLGKLYQIVKIRYGKPSLPF